MMRRTLLWPAFRQLGFPSERNTITPQLGCRGNSCVSSSAVLLTSLRELPTAGGTAFGQLWAAGSRRRWCSRGCRRQFSQPNTHLFKIFRDLEGASCVSLFLLSKLISTRSRQTFPNCVPYHNIFKCVSMPLLILSKSSLSLIVFSRKQSNASEKYPDDQYSRGFLTSIAKKIYVLKIVYNTKCGLKMVSSVNELVWSIWGLINPLHHGKKSLRNSKINLKQIGKSLTVAENRWMGPSTVSIVGTLPVWYRK